MGSRRRPSGAASLTRRLPISSAPVAAAAATSTTTAAAATTASSPDAITRRRCVSLAIHVNADLFSFDDFVDDDGLLRILHRRLNTLVRRSRQTRFDRGSGVVSHAAAVDDDDDDDAVRVIRGLDAANDTRRRRPGNDAGIEPEKTLVGAGRDEARG